MAEIVVRSIGGKLTQEIIAGDARKHRLLSDEPESLGGDDEGPTPYDLLLAALGSCTAMTLLMYARRKNWKLDRVTINLSHEKIHAKDCSDCESSNSRINQITRSIQVDGELDATQKERLLYIAEHCPVHKTLQSEIKIRDSIVPS